MLNIIWPIFIVISCIYGILTGKSKQMNDAIFNSAESAVNLCIFLLGTICLWNGIMKIALKSKLFDKLSRILNPVIKFLFPETYNEKEVNENISMNIVANVLGLGNAATPFGIKAMKSMQEKNRNKEKLSNSMIMFILINTASIQLIPTTIIAIRNSLNSTRTTDIIFPICISSITSVISVVLITKLLLKAGK